MTKKMSPIRYLAALTGGALLFTACGANASTLSDGPDRSLPSVSIVSPSEGAEISSSVDIVMSADGIDIEPAGEVRDGAGHFHLMINESCIEPGDVIPFDDSHLHFGDGSTTASLDLPPGDHTLCLQVGDGVHAALDLTDTVTFTVTS